MQLEYFIIGGTELGVGVRYKCYCIPIYCQELCWLWTLLKYDLKPALLLAIFEIE